jgi:hypothetical protein
MMMSDISVYNLARTVRKNLRTTALCQEPDLRRVVGHANMLDVLIAELVDLGYDWNDDVPSEQTATVEHTSFTPSGHVEWADQVLRHTATERLQYADDLEPSGDLLYDLEDSLDSDQSDNSNDSDGSEGSEGSDDWDDSDNLSESNYSDDSDVGSVEMFEKYGNRVTCYSKYILITEAQTYRDPSPDMSVLVAIREIR